jgi:manganese transport protein
MSDNKGISPFVAFFRSLGPAIIVASVVLGPGSILSASKVGTQYGYSMIWVLVLAGVFMAGMTALAARLGVSYEGSLCDELCLRLGRPFAALVGATIFGIATCFQFSNNLGVLAGIEPLLEGGMGKTAQIVSLVALNGVIISVLLGLKSLYRPIEKLMMIMMGLMLVGFAANLFFAKPSLSGVAGGFVPRLPGGGELADLLPLLAMVATTFSIAGAFYQAYLVREKGWTTSNLRQGLVDSLAGISVLVGITLIILTTAAAVLHGKLDAGELKSAADVAAQLKPAFGSAAVILFAQGILAGAFSSFLVNAMIGGTMLADGFGLGSKLDQKWPKIFTVASLLVGMGIAILIKSSDVSIVGLILFAQALTVLGGPVLAFSLMYLATRKEMVGERKVPAWIMVVGWTASAITVAMAVKKAGDIWSKIQG